MHTLGPNDNWIGFNIQGDIGPLTLYTSARGKLVGFLRAPPLNPPSPTQEAIREYFRQCAAEWRSLSTDQRNQWLQAARRARISIGGYNLYTWFWRTRNEDQLATIERQSGITLDRPAPLP